MRLQVKGLVLFCVKSVLILYSLLSSSVFLVFLTAIDFIYIAF